MWPGLPESLRHVLHVIAGHKPWRRNIILLDVMTCAGVSGDGYGKDNMTSLRNKSMNQSIKQSINQSVSSLAALQPEGRIASCIQLK